LDVGRCVVWGYMQLASAWISAYIRFVSRKMLQPNLSVEIMLNLTFGVLEICGPWFIFYVNFSRNRRSARRVNLFGRAFSRTAKNCGRGSASRRCAESRKAFACWFRWFLKVQGWWLQGVILGVILITQLIAQYIGENHNPLWASLATSVMEWQRVLNTAHLFSIIFHSSARSANGLVSRCKQ
jgi:hypothetical protein